MTKLVHRHQHDHDYHSHDHDYIRMPIVMYHRLPVLAMINLAKNRLIFLKNQDALQNQSANLVNLNQNLAIQFAIQFAILRQPLIPY